MNLTYVEFLKTTRGEGKYKSIKDFPDAIHFSHGSSHISFKEAYELAYKSLGVDIIPVHNSKTLRLGFIEDNDTYQSDTEQIWHSVRLEAWHTNANKGCELNEYIKKLEKGEI